MNDVSIIRTGNTERRVTKLHHIDGSYAGTISVTRPVSKNNKKRRSDYSFKQISAQVLNAKTSDKASQVRTSIGMKLNLLYKRRKSDEYDEEEIIRAILHAEQILRACKKKEKHLNRRNSRYLTLTSCSGDHIRYIIVKAYKLYFIFYMG